MTQPVPPVVGYADPRASGARTTSPLLVGLAWLIVGLPAAWGVQQTVIKSMALFRNAPAIPAATPLPASPAPSLTSAPSTAAG